MPTTASSDKARNNVIILTDQHSLSATAAIPWRVWEAGRMGYVNTTSKRTGSDKRFWSHKVIKFCLTSERFYCRWSDIWTFIKDQKTAPESTILRRRDVRV